MKVKSESEVAQSCPTLSNLMDCSLPGSSQINSLETRIEKMQERFNKDLEEIKKRVNI